MADVHNLRVKDVRSKEVVIWLTRNRYITGWWRTEPMLDREPWMEFHDRGFILRWGVPRQIQLSLTSPDHIMQQMAKQKVANTVAHFVDRVDSALRGGYA